MIYLTKTFEVVTPESAENGEAEETGFTFKNEPHTFREAVELIRKGGFVHPSESQGVPRWLSCEAEPDYRTGAETTYSIHPGRDAVTLRYWPRVLRFAGIKTK